MIFNYVNSLKFYQINYQKFNIFILVSRSKPVQKHIFIGTQLKLKIYKKYLDTNIIQTPA